MLDSSTARLLRCTDQQSAVDCLLHLGLERSGAALGNVQLMNWRSGQLTIQAQRGFEDEFLNYFASVTMGHGSACARALRDRESVIVYDVASDPDFLPFGKIMERAGVRAVHSTPIISSGGAFLGVVSTHFGEAHMPTALQKYAVQYAAQLAGDTLIRIRAVHQPVHRMTDASVARLQQSGDVIARTKQLLSRANRFFAPQAERPDG
ncbi:MAG TPA: GAF domain-containing protein [Rhizomicrobium sp.]|nr:GAF domain-containing protein [Rhizomicrobium sp.]